MSKNRILARTVPLTQEQKDRWFETHLPYVRTSLLNHLRVCEDPNLLGNMTEDEKHRVRVCCYEAGVLTCRRFIEFLGLTVAYNPYKLVEKKDYYTAREDGNAYEVKVVDLGGTWVDPNALTDKQRDLLQRIYLTGHRASVHLTDGSPYQGEYEIFHDAVKLVDGLLKKHLFDVVGINPSIQ